MHLDVNPNFTHNQSKLSAPAHIWSSGALQWNINGGQGGYLA